MRTYRLSERRQRLGLTQAVLAKRADVHPSQVSQAETKGAPQWAVKRLRRALVVEEMRFRDARQNEWRIARQRLLLRLLGPETAKEALIAALLDRAWRLLDCGETEAADALLEFVPEQLASELLDEFFFEDRAS